MPENDKPREVKPYTKMGPNEVPYETVDFRPQMTATPTIEETEAVEPETEQEPETETNPEPEQETNPEPEPEPPNENPEPEPEPIDLDDPPTEDDSKTSQSKKRGN